MVTSVTNCTRNGLSDWLVQRVTAIILGVFAVYLVVFSWHHDPMTYQAWHTLWTSTCFRVFATFVLFSILGHAWIGIWTVITDYGKPPALRLILEVLLILFLLAYTLCGCWILWR
jgi:succinate dehydrogenase / fumarate reductase membrane anchor subunit